jgi:catechol 2,3-dioxygenase-like lactoylglutathione lyase family enzyme
MTMQSAALSSVVLGVRDLDRSAEFYAGVLGFAEGPAPATDPPSGRPVRRFDAGPALIELVEAGADGDPGGWVNDDLQVGMRHFGMKVGDVDAQVRKLVAAGVTVLSPPTDVLGGVRIAFFLDPDGARLEYIQGNLDYQQVYSPALAAAEAATGLGPGDGPRFDHVAVTVADLPAALRFWREGFGFQPIGEIRHHDDARGFLMTYLRAGTSVLELFSFDVPAIPNPVPRDPGRLLGMRGIAVAGEGVDTPMWTVDPAGVPVSVRSAR